MSCMDIDEIRRENIKALEREMGTALVKKLGMSPAQFYNLRDGAKDSKTGKPRGMRKETAWRIEDAAEKPRGWLSIDHHQNSHGNTYTATDIKGTVPLISWVQAGNWQEAVDNLSVGDGERIVTTYKPRNHTYALRVKGDSMEPKFSDGCIIIVEPEQEPQPGNFVIVRQNGNEATFKQLIKDGGVYLLKPLNDRYPIMELKSDAVFCGVVKQMMMDV